MDSLVGTVISHYKIIERIGAGGMGVVYKAEDTKLGRIVALKFLPPEMTRDKKAKERFVQEARAASAIEHSSICTIFEVDEIEDDRIFISMAYYQGKTLKDRIAEGPLELREALDIASQAAHGLAKAHSNGIVHRDIKPGNIFITDDHEVKIVDFGLAKLAGQVRLTSTGKTMGTVSYMSPEQARGEESGPQTDIWALGVVLYEMATGTLPFKGDYDVAVVYSIMNEEPPAMSEIRPGIPDELENIVKKALAKKASDRYQNASELISDLSALKQQLDFSTFTGTSEWKFKNKGRRWIYAAGAVAIIVAVAAVVWLIAANRKHPSTGLPGKAHQVTNGDVWHGDPALSPDGGTIAYSAEDSGNADIYLINVTGGNPLRLADDRAADYYPAWFPDGSAIAFVSERGGSPSIWKVSQLGGGATLLVKDAIDPAIDPFGKRIAFAALMPNGDVRIGVAPLADPADVTLLTRSEDIAWEHRMPAWSPDGRSICFTTRSGLWIVLASGGPSRRLTTGGYGDQEPVWSSDGKYVYFSSAREGTVALWRVAAEGGRVERRTSGSSYEHNPTISRDGARMAYATQTEPGSMLIRDLSSGAEKKVLGMRNISIAAISPDASMLAYASDRGGPSYDLWLQPLERGVPTGQPQRLTDDTADASCPAFSPDGKWIAYHRILGDERDIFTISISGGKPIQFTNDPAQDTQPSWSHNGTKIVFASDRGGGSRIWVAPVSNGIPAGPPRPVTPEALMAGAPVWSHDGESIAFIGVAGGANDVYVIPADGRSPPERVTDGAGAMAIRWDGVAGSLLASGTWKEDTYSLRRITLGRRATAPIDPPVVFGSLTALPTFDVSFDGRFVVYGHESKVGNIWIHEAPKKTF